MKLGKLIVFEGANEVGKSTLAGMFAASLRQAGEPCRLLAFPGNEPGTLGRHVYAMHHESQRFQIGEINATSLQILHVAAHIDAIDAEILPALRQGETVVLDRYWWSTWVYGSTGGAAKKTLRAAIAAENVHWGKVRPAHIFLISRAAPLQSVRADPPWAKLAKAYLALARQEKRRQRVSVIQNDTTPDAALLDIQRQLSRPARRR